MIAITGGSGSGKTTLAKALRARLGEAACALMVEDNYYLPRARQSPATVGWSSDEVEAAVDFDDPAAKDMALFRRHLVALRDGHDVDQPVYDFATHDRVEGAVHRIDARPVVIVEGVHVLSDPDFKTLFDLTVFIDAPDDLRLARRIRRDRIERGRSSDGAIRQYLAFVRPAYLRFTGPARSICDLVVDDDGRMETADGAPDATAVERLVAPVWARLRAMGVAS